MQKSEFLWELRKKLKRLPQNEIENAIGYYEEYFNDAGVENEQRVLNELGSPAAVASKIIGEYAFNDAEEQKKNGMGALFIVLLAVFASPVALPLALAVVVVALSLIFALFMVFLSFGIAAIALIGSGLIALIAGFYTVFTSVPTGVFFVGSALLTISIGVSIIVGTIALSKVTFNGIQKLLAKFLIKRGTK